LVRRRTTSSVDLGVLRESEQPVDHLIVVRVNQIACTRELLIAFVAVSYKLSTQAAREEGSCVIL